MPGHLFFIRDIIFDRSTSRLFTADDSGLLRCWDLQSLGISDVDQAEVATDSSSNIDAKLIGDNIHIDFQCNAAPSVAVYDLLGRHLWSYQHTSVQNGLILDIPLSELSHSSDIVIVVARSARQVKTRLVHIRQ